MYVMSLNLKQVGIIITCLRINATIVINYNRGWEMRLMLVNAIEWKCGVALSHVVHGIT